MSAAEQPHSHIETQTLSKGIRFANVHTRLQRRTGPIALAVGMLLMGLVLGIGIALLYAFAISGNSARLVTTPARTGNIIVQANKAFLTHLVEKNLRTSGLPGNIKNVRVTLVSGDQMTISGDDGFSLLGMGVSRQFTIEVQPYVSACQLQIHVLHADLADIPVTEFARAFESQINQQLQMKSTGLPSGFTYCMVGVRTELQGMFVMYSATPV
jgi:hypothetical protein